MSTILHNLVKTNLSHMQCKCSLSHFTLRYASSNSYKDEPQWRKLMYNADGSIKDYYETLGLPSTATFDEIKKIYYDLNKLLHPDSRIVSHTNIDHQTALNKLREAQEAYHVLRSRKRRAEYDSERRRIAMLLAPDVEELVHDITGWVSKTDKSKHTLHEKVRQTQYAHLQRYKRENTDPNTFIQMAHRTSMFNRKLAQEQEIASAESQDIKQRRQRTLDYKLWKQKMKAKNANFGNMDQKLSDPYLNEKIERLGDINAGNRDFYQKLRNEMDSSKGNTQSNNTYEYAADHSFHSGPTPNAYYDNINPRSPFGGDTEMQTQSKNTYNNNNMNSSPSDMNAGNMKGSSNCGSNPENYDDNIAFTVKEAQKIKIHKTVNIAPAIGEIHSDIKGVASANPDANKWQRDHDRQQIYEEWKEKEREKQFKRNKGEALQIEGRVDESVRGYTWFENVGATYKDEYRDGMEQNRKGYNGYKLNEMRGVGSIKGNKAYAYNFTVDTNKSANAYYTGYYGKDTSDLNMSSMANSMIIGHLGIIGAFLFVVISWRGATMQ